MRTSRSHASKLLTTILGGTTLISVAFLLAGDVFPKAFPPRAHDVLGALPLASVAFTYLAYQASRRPSTAELLKAAMLAAAFLFWSANQFWPLARLSTLFNDLAVVLFVLDVLLVIIGWPAASPVEHRTSLIEPARES
jgi:hypothetical protein